jgi:molecular chaperone DnaJ
MDPYEALGLKRDATQEQITRAYRRIALQCHPDKDPSEKAHQRFLEISGAYDLLRDETKRKFYDRTGRVPDHDMDFDWVTYFKNLFRVSAAALQR